MEENYLNRNFMNLKVGIIIVSYNASDYVNVTLGSIFHSKSKIDYELLLVDNASSDVEISKIRDSFEKYKKQNVKLPWKIITLEKNLGFSGGNNYGIKEFSKNTDITHYCLLNSDVIVNDYWLDRLLKHNKNFISCVTNKADSNQCIPVNYDFNIVDCLNSEGTLNKQYFDIVNKFAGVWHNTWSGNIVATEPTFFCVLISRSIIDQIGLLDETFFPGGFEDDDYCMRASSANISTWLARDVFIHHFGSGSFGALPSSYFSDNALKNKRYLEQKHNIIWKMRAEKPFESFFFDLIYSLGSSDTNTIRSAFISEYINNLSKLLDHYVLENDNLRKTFTLVNFKNDEYEFILTRTQNIDSKSIIDQWNTIIKLANSSLLSKKYNLNEITELKQNMVSLLQNIHFLVINNLDMHHYITNNSDIKIAESITKSSKFAKLSKLFKILFSFKGVVFLGGYPYPERENDGYFQRIKAIDLLFQDRYRVYVESGEPFAHGKLFDRPAKKVIVLRYSGTNFNKLKCFLIVCALVIRTRCLYSHSVLRINEGLNKLLFKIPFVKKVIDIHGVVPEEFRMYNDFYSARIYESLEKLAISNSNMIISVTNSMKLYLQNKYRELFTGKSIVLPIFSSTRTYADDKSYFSSKPIVVYAGGTHKWQQIPKMVNSILKTTDYYSFKIFCPNVTDMKDLFKVDLNELTDLEISSKDQNELFKIYESCHFGLVLREDVVVNNVACPTKLIEYIAMGIVPILDSPNLGDFKSLNIKYVSLEDFEKNNIPNEERRNEMAQHNFKLLSILKEYRYKSSNDLYAFMSRR